MHLLVPGFQDRKESARLVHLRQPAELLLLLVAGIHELATAVVITFVAHHGVKLEKLVAHGKLEFDGDILSGNKRHRHC